MILGIVFWIVLVLVFIVLIKGLRQWATSDTTVKVPREIVEVKSKPSIWQKDPNFSPLARDRQEVLEIWEKCANDPSCPPPIPPVKPTVYFGNETIAGGFDPKKD